MKFVCSKSNLVSGLQIVSKAVPSKTTMSILECILVDATEGVIKFIANDMELGIQTIVDGDIVERGFIALDAKLFVDIVRKLPDNNVTIESDSSNKVTISCEKAKFNLIGRKGDDFTYLPAIEKIDGVSVSHFTLRNVIQQTIFSIAEFHLLSLAIPCFSRGKASNNALTSHTDNPPGVAICAKRSLYLSAGRLSNKVLFTT